MQIMANQTHLQSANQEHIITVIAKVIKKVKLNKNITKETRKKLISRLTVKVHQINTLNSEKYDQNNDKVRRK